MNKDIYASIKERPEYSKYLYRYGFLITTSEQALEEKCFILKSWHHSIIGKFSFWIHPDQKLYTYAANGITFFLIGHCYNPFTMTVGESDALSALAAAFQNNVDAYCEELSDLTGIFMTGYIADNSITIYGDAAGMFMTYYGFANACIWISSHAKLLGDLNDLTQSAYVQKLVGYRFYPLFGFSLPGDLSPYDEFKRLVPNHSVCINGNRCILRRFYPVQSWDSMLNQFTIDQRVEEIVRILNCSMGIIPQKWSNPAISLTGGCDSKTTLACTFQHYDQYQYFSYISQEAEAVDAHGAHDICSELNLRHSVYSIPEGKAKDQELVQAIMRVNQGDIGTPNMREVQKRIYLAGLDNIDVEVKSWVSEIARAYYHKRFSKKRFPARPTARYLTTLYKVFLNNRRLVKETDNIFEKYIATYLCQDGLKNWSWIDLFFWEFRVGSWNGLVITGEHRYSFDITIPYNNRHLLALMLSIPEDMRITDELYWKIRAYANKAVEQAGIQITNLKHTSNRAKLERVYLEMHSRFPW